MRQIQHIQAIWVLRIRSTLAPSKVLEVCTNRPLWTPILEWLTVSSTPPKHPLRLLIYSMIGYCRSTGKMTFLCCLTDRGTEYCGKADRHDFQLYLATKDIEHTRTNARHPQTNGICERFHKTILQAFYQPTLRRKIYATIDELQADLNNWLDSCNNERTHQGK